MWLLPALAGAACEGGVHFLLDDHENKTWFDACTGAARALAFAGVLAGLFLLLTGGSPVAQGQRFYKDILCAILIVLTGGLTAYALPAGGAMASGVLHFSLLSHIALEVIYKKDVVNVPTLMCLVAFVLATYGTTHFFEEANS